MERRHFLFSTALVLGLPMPSLYTDEGTPPMYGLIGKIEVAPGQREALARILLEGVSGMPGCLSYVVANDLEDPDALWVTEVWETQDSHAASLALPSVQEAIAKGRPLITGFASQVITQPLGGHGLGQ